jgi:hypothetical protein
MLKLKILMITSDIMMFYIYIYIYRIANIQNTTNSLKHMIYPFIAVLFMKKSY